MARRYHQAGADRRRTKGWAPQMTEGSGYGPFLTRRGRGNVLTHFIMTVLGAGLAVVLLLAFYSPASGGSGSSSPGSGMVPAPASPAAPLGKNAQDIAARVRPGVVIINTALRYNSEQAAGTGMVINSSGLVLTNNHVIDDSTSITVTCPPRAGPIRRQCSATTRPATSP